MEPLLITIITIWKDFHKPHHTFLKEHDDGQNHTGHQNTLPQSLGPHQHWHPRCSILSLFLLGPHIQLATHPTLTSPAQDASSHFVFPVVLPRVAKGLFWAPQVTPRSTHVALGRPMWLWEGQCGSGTARGPQRRLQPPPQVEGPFAYEGPPRFLLTEGSTVDLLQKATISSQEGL